MTQIINDKRPAILAYLRGRGASAEEAAAVFQVACEEFSKKADPQPGILKKIARRRWIDSVRKSTAKKAIRTVPMPREDDLPSVRATQRDEIEVEDILGLARRNLPPRQLQAVQLVHFEGLSRREAAEAMGIARQSIEKLLGKADPVLRKSLTEDGWSPG